jgi:RHS repeat-associated protein
MNPFRTIHKTQAIRDQYPYFPNLTCGVCLQNTSEYSPFGVSLDGRTMQRESYRYGFNGQEETAEITGDGNHTTAQYWEYDTRLGRRWNLDPKPNPSISNYACFANNPILYADPLGDTLRGVSKVSAMRTRNEILNTFQGEKFDAFKKLIQIDKKDNVTFKHISDKKFDEATKDFSADELAMANAYKKSINMSQTHYVDMTKREETLSPQATSALRLPAGTTGAYADSEYGGGVNTSYRGGSLTVVVLNSKVQIDFVYASNKVHYNRISTPAELLSHELLGHGVGRVLGTTGYYHNDAIQMTNLYWRVRGYKTFYRDGTYHGSQVVLSPQTAQKIPTHYN